MLSATAANSANVRFIAGSHGIVISSKQYKSAQDSILGSDDIAYYSAALVGARRSAIGRDTHRSPAGIPLGLHPSHSPIVIV